MNAKTSKSNFTERRNACPRSQTLSRSPYGSGRPEAAEKLVPMCKDVSTELAEGYYDAATTCLAELKAQVEHTSAVISILRDWQAANQKTSQENDKRS